MKRIVNEMKLRLPARSENEGAARSAISAFAAILNPTVEELGDVRLAVSEAVTNAIVHAYGGDESGLIYISVRLYEDREISVEIADKENTLVEIPDDSDIEEMPKFASDKAPAFTADDADDDNM